MNKLILIVLLATIISNQSQAQQQPQSEHKSIDQLMREKIVLLKNGALLVRMQTKENSIKALRDGGNLEQANQVETKQQAFNKEVIAAFRSEFKFCPVYFFPSHYSENILGGNVSAVVFLNDSMSN